MSSVDCIQVRSIRLSMLGHHQILWGLNLRRVGEGTYTKISTLQKKMYAIEKYA